jgi:hypothetical protein
VNEEVRSGQTERGLEAQEVQDQGQARLTIKTPAMEEHYLALSHSWQSSGLLPLAQPDGMEPGPHGWQ